MQNRKIQRREIKKLLKVTQLRENLLLRIWNLDEAQNHLWSGADVFLEAAKSSTTGLHQLDELAAKAAEAAQPGKGNRWPEVVSKPSWDRLLGCWDRVGGSEIFSHQVWHS